MRLKQLLLIVVALVACAPPTAHVQPAWPELSGPFQVGRLELDVVDASRDEKFTDDPTDRRRLLVSVYYPATVPAGAQHAPYATPELAGVAPFFGGLRRDAWLSPSYANVPVADGRFPVLLFSPGLGSLTVHYESLLSELASRGFVVAALWHPYSAQVVAFPDGTVVWGNAAGSMNGAPAAEQEARHIQLCAVWAADQRFLLDRLAVWNEQHAQLRGRLDLERAGAIGHSLGGAAAAQAAYEDERIDAAINLDGAMFGSVTTEGLRAPFLLLVGEPPVMTDTQIQQAGWSREQADAWIDAIANGHAGTIARSRDARSQKLDGAKHNAFMTDVLFSDLPAEQRRGQTGDVEPTAAFKQISDWIGEFTAANVRDAK
jgi:predicted dienelactone hydrolase